MSAIHPHWRFDVKNMTGNLVIMPCPGCKDVDLTTSLNQLKQNGVTHILTLMTNEEMQRSNVSTIPEQCQAIDLEWLHFPIEDDCVPSETDSAEWTYIQQSIQNAVKNGGSVAVHCKGGSGRAGLCTAMLLLDFGHKLQDAMDMIKEVRPSAFGNPAQIAFLKSYCENVAA